MARGWRQYCLLSMATGQLKHCRPLPRGPCREFMLTTWTAARRDRCFQCRQFVDPWATSAASSCSSASLSGGAAGFTAGMVASTPGRSAELREPSFPKYVKGRGTFMPCAECQTFLAAWYRMGIPQSLARRLERLE